MAKWVCMAGSNSTEGLRGSRKKKKKTHINLCPSLGHWSSKLVWLNLKIMGLSHINVIACSGAECCNKKGSLCVGV